MSKRSLTRRDFMKFLTGSTVLSSMGQLGFSSLANAALPDFATDDYKALVCVFMTGGNDSFNTFIPIGSADGSGYHDYQAIRGDLAVSDNALDHVDLNNAQLGTGSSNPYYNSGSEEKAYLQGVYSLSNRGIDLGVNGLMPEISQLVQNKRASILANIGTLVRPVTRAEILAKTADLPVFLFAHNHQQRILQTGQAQNTRDIGWAGKIADYWAGINKHSPLGLNISYGGNNRMLIGQQSSPLILGTGNPPYFDKMLPGDKKSYQDRKAVFQALMGVSNSSNKVNFAEENTFVTNDRLKKLYNSMLHKSVRTFDLMYESWKNNELTYQSTGSYGEELFAIPSANDIGFSNELDGRFIQKMEAVAKMIHLGATGKFSGERFNRQVFFVNLGSFDTHNSQHARHSLLLREFSLGVWKFQRALEEQGLINKVMTFTMSDFGRTMSNNGDGTDHAWGGHHLVIGGDGQLSTGNLRGGAMWGVLPDITLGGEDDYANKGRIIPKLSQDQLNATLCRWFGVDEAFLATIFPNLSNFETQAGNRSSAYLNDLFVTI